MKDSWEQELGSSVYFFFLSYCKYIPSPSISFLSFSFLSLFRHINALLLGFFLSFLCSIFSFLISSLYLSPSHLINLFSLLQFLLSGILSSLISSLCLSPSPNLFSFLLLLSLSLTLRNSLFVNFFSLSLSPNLFSFLLLSLSLSLCLNFFSLLLYFQLRKSLFLNFFSLPFSLS
ncbi:unnamed protein product [Acanthosepion pharaonis]|uniref:Uncharacterized protein n=1 Tax=Acanthosepion pharaonis TaxID=158019 RepID=A0A812D8T3_ACAPH|nr:unnamed protein product [Sepia pharaonis]